MTLDQALMVANQLSLSDKLRLIQQLIVEIDAALIESSIKLTPQPIATPKVSSWGALAHLGPAPSEEDIDSMRQEAWAGFGAKDI
jgi:hypothetical protein